MSLNGNLYKRRRERIQSENTVLSLSLAYTVLLAALTNTMAKSFIMLIVVCTIRIQEKRGYSVLIATICPISFLAWLNQ